MTLENNPESYAPEQPFVADMQSNFEDELLAHHDYPVTDAPDSLGLDWEQVIVQDLISRPGTIYGRSLTQPEPSDYLPAHLYFVIEFIQQTKSHPSKINQEPETEVSANTKLPAKTGDLIGDYKAKRAAARARRQAAKATRNESLQ